MTSNAARTRAISSQPAVSARPGLLTRLKLSEPVRLYLYGLGAVALLGLTLAGVLTGEWSDYWVHVLAVVLGVVPAAEGVRASVYSTQGHVQGLLRAQGHVQGLNRAQVAALASARIDQAAGL